MDGQAHFDVRRLFREARFIDVFACVYYPALALIALCGTGVKEGRGFCVTVALALWTWAMSGVVVARSGRWQPSLWTAVYYRLSLALPITCSYLMLKTLLPIVRPDNYDAVLYRIDVSLFGVEPTLWLDGLITPLRTEWFSFFYYSYFYLITASILGVLLRIDDTRIGLEFAIGTTLCFCIGHFGYMVVPGYGPYSHLAGHFTNELPRGVFYKLVLQTVSQAGAHKDIFPSLHTAVPTFLTLFAIRWREQVWAYKRLWPVLAFFNLNIVIATVYLRWHYLIDVFAGLALASSMLGVASWLAKKDLCRTAREKLDEPWPLLRPKTTSSSSHADGKTACA